MSREQEDMSPEGLRESLEKLTNVVMLANGDPGEITVAVMGYSHAEVNCMLTTVIEDLEDCRRRLGVALAATELLSAAVHGDDDRLNEAEDIVESDEVQSLMFPGKIQEKQER
jgi:hypothetical protein